MESRKGKACGFLRKKRKDDRDTPPSELNKAPEYLRPLPPPLGFDINAFFVFLWILPY